ASAGAQGRRAGDRPAERHSPHLPCRPGWPRRASRGSGALLGEGPGRLQDGRRATSEGGQMSTHTQTTATSIHIAIVVEAPIERAFRVFTEDFDQVKPREHNMLGVDIAETVFEPRAGGRVYDRGVDGSEFHWARVLLFEPPNRLVFSWDLNPRFQIESN